MSEGKKYYYEHDWRTLYEIAQMTGMHRDTLARRIERGMTLLQAIDYNPPPKAAKPRSEPRMITFAGKTMTIPQWAKHLGMSECTLRDRINMFRWPVERALTEPVMSFGMRSRRARNRRLIRRIAASFTSVTNTGGYSTTFTDPMGTGPGRHARHLQTEKELSP